MTREQRRTTKRSYRSPLRATLAEETRRRILDAALEEMEGNGPEGFSVPGVAARSGIAQRTIYRHFPNRDALVDAMWLEAYDRFDWLRDVTSAEALTAAVVEAGPRNQEMRALLEAALRCPRQVLLCERTRRQRMDHVARALAPQIERLGPVAQRRVLGVLHALGTPSFWHQLHLSWCPDGRDAGEAAAWAMRVLLAELRRNPRSPEESASAEA